ncbi:hypothetical protein [Halobacterium salinarum]|uniref:hypothetical protein n=1 Tax=Halobacterium salinarum TaxID=2242 RepID=UPI00255362AB|nr:hypothetical protein [Halobacterium salinarum]MDL0145965.1 hypothetical protein [Halobacterium salinarum]
MSADRQQKTGSEDCGTEIRFEDWSQREADAQPALCDFVLSCGNPIDEPDTNNATKLYKFNNFPDNISSKKCWKKLDKYNSGLINLKWTNSAYNTYLLNRHHILALSSQLDLSSRQRRQVYNQFMQLELEDWGVSANLVAFCVCAVTVHSDDTNREYHYNQADENKDSKFIQIADSLGLREKSIRKFYSKYRSYVDGEGGNNYDYLKYQKRSPDRKGI